VHTGRARAAGFTLLELLVVVVIIGLLAGLVAPRYFDSVSKSKSKIAKAQIESLDKALDQYRLDVGSYPTAEQGLRRAERAALGRREVARAVPEEGPAGRPLGQRLRLRAAAGGKLAIDIVSYGADGKPGGTGEAQDVSLHSAN
jgi:general secretion pathway protein G